MAYLRAIEMKCDASGCARTARVELFNAMNAVLGNYCRRCGIRRLCEQNASEAIRPSNLPASKMYLR